MNEIKFIRDYSAAIVEELECDNGVFERGGNVKIFELSKVSCFTARMDTGEYRVTLYGGEDFYVTKGDFEKLVTNTIGYNFRADNLWS